MAFKDLREFLNSDIELPIGGNVYRIPSPTAEEGLRLRMLFVNPDEAMGDAEELAEMARLLGAHWEPNLVEVPVYDPVSMYPVLDDQGEPVTRTADRGSYVGGTWSAMVADGVTWPELDHAARTALMHFGVGAMVAEMNWGTAYDGQPGNPVPPGPVSASASGARSSKPKKRAAAKKAAKSTSRSRARTGQTTQAAASGSLTSD